MWISIRKLRYFGPFPELGAPAEDCEAARRYRSEKRRMQFLAGRQAARALLDTHTAVDGSSWHMHENAQGRPYAVAPSNDAVADISISHSGPFVAAALTTRGRIGIDIERSRPIRSSASIAEAYFSCAEQQLVVAEGERAFLRLWTLREAIGKATGSGLTSALAFDGGILASLRSHAACVCVGENTWILGSRDLGEITLSCALLLEANDPAETIGTMGRELAKMAHLVRDNIAA